MYPILIYCYDAYCGWCYGFSPVIKKIFEEYQSRFQFETLSGNMIPVTSAYPIGRMAGYIQNAYKNVEEHTGIKFGEDYLWHIFHPDESDWEPHSEKAAIALCVFKDYYPGQSVLFAADLQYALHYEGRDLTDDEAYRHLCEKYNIPAGEFYSKLHNEEYKEKAYYEFTLVKQLQVNGFPTVFIQTGESKLYLIARGYTDYESLEGRIVSVLKELSATTPS
jgi:putative protein-disulfide isomerase